MTFICHAAQKQKIFLLVLNNIFKSYFLGSLGVVNVMFYYLLYNEMKKHYPAWCVIKISLSKRYTITHIIVSVN